MSKLLIKIKHILTDIDQISVTKTDVIIDTMGKIVQIDTDMTDLKFRPSDKVCVVFAVDTLPGEHVKEIVRCGRSLEDIKRFMRKDYSGGYYDLKF